MAFEDLAGFIDPGFDLPVRGKTYRVPAPNARDGLWMQALVDAGETLLLSGAVANANKVVLADDQQERTMYQMGLGPAYDQMLEDGVAWPIVKHAGLTAVLYWTRGKDAAQAHWAKFGDAPGEALTQPPPETAGSPTETSTPTPA